MMQDFPGGLFLKGFCVLLVGTAAGSCGKMGSPTELSDSGEQAGSEATSTTSTGHTESIGPTIGEPTSDSPTEAMNFLPQPDVKESISCDPWLGGCPEGQKCRPYMSHEEWGGAECVPVEPNPGGPQDACTSPEWSDNDDCAEGTICFGFLQEGDSRRCLKLCEGTPQTPLCADTCSFCSVLSDGLFGVCSIACDPLSSKCPEHHECLMLSDLPRFICIPVGSQPPSAPVGAVCLGSPLECQQGAVCLDAKFVPGCQGEKCCAPICRLSEKDLCTSKLSGTSCSPWPDASPDVDLQCIPPDMGVCRLR